MALSVPPVFANRWDAAPGLSELDALVYRSNLLASDRAIVNFGGGNTSVKVREPDHTGRQTTVLWVKGSGSDLATITPGGFTGLRLEEIVPLAERASMTDEEMVAYLARCQLAPSMPRPSIETLLHAFVPHAHVDHTHPDAIGAIVGTVDGERLARECFGADAVWIPYLRPGFALSKLVAEAIGEQPEARTVLLAKHGLVTWGDTAEESYAATLEAINRAASFIADRTAGNAVFGGPRGEPLGDDERNALLVDVLPRFGARSRSTGDGSCRSTSRRMRSSSRAAPTRRSSLGSARPAPTTSSTRDGRRSGSTSTARATTRRRCASAPSRGSTSGRSARGRTSSGTATVTRSVIPVRESSSFRTSASCRWGARSRLHDSPATSTSAQSTSCAPHRRSAGSCP